MVENFNVLLTPSPFQKHFTIHIISKIELFGHVDILIMDNSGNLVHRFQKELNGAHSVFNCDELEYLPAGIYYLVFTINDVVVIRKVVKM